MSKWHCLGAFRYLFWLGLFGLLGACGGGGPTAETLASFSLELPSTTLAAEPFTLNVIAVGSKGTKPFKSFSGPVALSVSAGTLSPQSLNLNEGVGSAQVSIVGTAGSVEISAKSGSAASSKSIGVSSNTALPGPDTSPANTAIPKTELKFREQDYSTDHPDLPGLKISFNTLFVVFEISTTVKEANDILKSINATIVGGETGVGNLEGILLLRLPTTTHAQMTAVLNQLRRSPKVKIAVPHSQSEIPQPLEEVNAQLLPNPNGGTPANWTWDLAVSGDNWGLERIRVPQMWNFNHVIEKKNTSTVVGVLDGGTTAHTDLEYLVNGGTGAATEHGLHVSGTIAATHNNGKGVDGVNPFARLVTQPYDLSGDFGLLSLIDSRPDLKVVNISLGENWYKKSPPINPTTNAAAQQLILSQGAVLDLFLKNREANGKQLPLIVVAAGNDSGRDLDGDGTLDNLNAMWSSSITFASILLTNPHILVVESVALSAASAGGATRTSFSNLGGHISAPGSSVTSTVEANGYKSLSGTSMAAPHVTGLVSYLLALDPTLTHAEIRQLLTANSVAVAGGASNRIDAFASASAINALRGNDALLKEFLDIDDGTPDGNQRRMIGVKNVAALDADSNGLDDTALDAEGRLEFLETGFEDEDADADQGLGDGKVDMSDFRRWRDWLLEAEDNADLSLDGQPDHPKKDLNGDSQVGNNTEENTYPKGDFNGSGQLSRLSAAKAWDGEYSDLQVLQKVFSDPHYQAAQLPDLINSVDITVWPKTFYKDATVKSVRSSIRLNGTDKANPLEQRNHTNINTPEMYTVAVGQAYTVRVEGLDSAGEVVREVEADYPSDTQGLLLGGDVLVDPSNDCKAPEGVKYCVAEIPVILPTSPKLSINDSGQVVGSALTAVSNGRGYAFIWQNGKVTNLGGLAEPVGINNLGQVAGVSTLNRPVIWQNGQVTDLGTPQESLFTPIDINDTGQVLGFGGVNGHQIWHNGTMTKLGALVIAYYINNQGQVAGLANPDGKVARPHIWQDGQTLPLEILGGFENSGTVSGLNNQGKVIGTLTKKIAPGAFAPAPVIWENRQATILSALGDNALAKGINDSGQIVGQKIYDGRDVRAVLLDNGQVTNLNTQIDPSLGWVLREAKAINNQGQILGIGRLNNTERAFLLTPAEQ